MSASPRDPEIGPRPLLALGCWAGLSLLYLILAGGANGPEAVAGGIAALAATVAMRASGSREHLGRMRPAWWLILIRRLPLQVIRDTIALLVASIRPSIPRGRFQSLAFRAGGDDPVSGSRRALIVFGVSIAPGTYVVTIDRGRQQLLTHQLPAAEGPSSDRGDPEWPI